MTVAVLVSLFTWWFATGAVLWLAGRRRLPPAWMVAATAPIAVISPALLVLAGADTGPMGAYLGFAGAILLWGWFELAFLTGVITGPNRAPCPLGARGMRRFRAAWRTVSHHELSLGAATLLLLALLWDAANPTGLWTFLVLFGARISAKLNIYLGVPHLAHDMLPEPVAHLKSYFARRRVSLLYPVSITVLSAAMVLFAERALCAPAGSGAEAGFTLVATLTALAALEHWLMIIPIRETALWRWAASGLESRSGPAPGRAD